MACQRSGPGLLLHRPMCVFRPCADMCRKDAPHVRHAASAMLSKRFRCCRLMTPPKRAPPSSGPPPRGPALVRHLTNGSRFVSRSFSLVWYSVMSSQGSHRAVEASDHRSRGGVGKGAFSKEDVQAAVAEGVRVALLAERREREAREATAAREREERELEERAERERERERDREAAEAQRHDADDARTPSKEGVPVGLASAWLSSHGYYPGDDGYDKLQKVYCKVQPGLAERVVDLPGKITLAVRNARAYLSRTVKDILMLELTYTEDADRGIPVVRSVCVCV